MSWFLSTVRDNVHGTFPNFYHRLHMLYNDFRRRDRQRAPHLALLAAAPPLPAPPRPTERPAQKEEEGGEEGERRGRRKEEGGTRLPSRSVLGAIFPVFLSRRRLCRQGIMMCHCDCRPLSRCDCRPSSRCDCRPSCRCFLQVLETSPCRGGAAKI